VVSSTPRPHFTPRKDPVPILQEAVWVPGPVWTDGKSRPHRHSIPDRPARSSVAIPTELPAHTTIYNTYYNELRIQCIVMQFWFSGGHITSVVQLRHSVHTNTGFNRPGMVQCSSITILFLESRLQ